LLHQADGMKDAALVSLEQALRAAAPTGHLRIFVDECEHLQVLLEELKPRLTDEVLSAYAGLLLEAMRCPPAKPGTGFRQEPLLSGRELEVMHFLAQGLTYEDIGKHLYLSLNTVQFHVKSIYRKLLVNKRVQAIDKARQMKLI
jgi:LuxR family maltose regulon positive regulatory protein